MRGNRRQHEILEVPDIREGAGWHSHFDDPSSSRLARPPRQMWIALLPAPNRALGVVTLPSYQMLPLLPSLPCPNALTTRTHALLKDPPNPTTLLTRNLFKQEKRHHPAPHTFITQLPSDPRVSWLDDRASWWGTRVGGCKLDSGGRGGGGGEEGLSRGEVGT